MNQEDPPPYHALLPETLHQQAGGLIDYLRELPYEPPAACYFCGNKAFYIASTSDEGIRYYRCSRCKKGFNSLTGTPLASTRHPDTWADFACWRLSGLSLNQIAQKIGISLHAVKTRDKKLLHIMQEQTPALYRWWNAHQNRQGTRTMPLIEAQKRQFQRWLDELVHPQHVSCPYCGHASYLSLNEERPQFVCTRCKKAFNPLVYTPFKKMHFIYLWPRYFDLITQGLSHRDISRELHISRRSLIDWRRKFIEQMQKMQLTELEQWMQWQLRRRFVEIKRQDMHK